MSVSDINIFESAHSSSLHKEALELLDRMAKAGKIAESTADEVAGRKAYWRFIPSIPLDSPLIQIVDKHERSIRKVNLPSSISGYVSDFCSGCIETAIHLLDQITKDVTARVGMSSDESYEKKRSLQLKNLQNHCQFLRDIATIIHRNKKRPERYYSALESKTFSEKLDIDLKDGEQVWLLIPKIQTNYSPSKFTFKGKCMLCHRYNETKSTYCFEHTRNNTKEKDSAIRRRQNQFKRAYENLNIKNTIDQVAEAKNPSNNISRLERKKS